MEFEAPGKHIGPSGFPMKTADLEALTYHRDEHGAPTAPSYSVPALEKPHYVYWPVEQMLHAWGVMDCCCSRWWSDTLVNLT